MRIRFEAAKADEVGREDELMVHYAPSRRPRYPHLAWYVLLGCLSLVLVVVALVATGSATCR